MHDVKANIMFLDIETTGFAKTDEVLQLAFITTAGEEFNCFYRPTHTESWPKAQEINNISPEMVKNKFPFESEINLKEIQKSIDTADIIVGHNIKSFDIPFLEKYGLDFSQKIVHDTRSMYKKAYPSKSSRLIDCAEFYSYQYDAHDAMEDVKACKHVYVNLIREGR